MSALAQAAGGHHPNAKSDPFSKFASLGAGGCPRTRLQVGREHERIQSCRSSRSIFSSRRSRKTLASVSICIPWVVVGGSLAQRGQFAGVV